jgi:DNA-binding transcriptional MerR regulator
MADEHDEETQLLEPVEPAQLLKNLELTTGKAAEFAGVSRRQLCYWTDTGIVSAVEGGGDDDDNGDSSARRTYDFDALHRVLLIKRALEHSAGLRRAAREVDQHITERRRKAKELGDSIEQNRDEFLTEQADKLEAIAARIQQLVPELKDREQVSELYQALEWLDRLAERVQAGEVLLEEDAEACLRLASRTDQAEAKLESMSGSD